jgi:biopolymer transport protein ExbD
MPLKMHDLEEPQLNLTPMIDVVFNLIIFFMVGTRFADMERQFDVQLPEVAHAQPLTAPPDEIIINLFANGRVVIAGRDLSFAELRDELAAARSRYEEQAVLVRADGHGTVQLLAEVFAVCQEVGIRNYALAAQAGDGASGGGS